MSTVLTAQEPSAKYLANLQPPLVQHFDLIAQAPGGVARLRELILTLAVQGKLVPQDPRDEPASVLLQKIRAEKDRLIAEGKIKRDKPLAEIADEEKPFELPPGWEWVRNSNLFSLRKGKVPKDISDKSEGFPYLDIDALDRNIVKRYSTDASAPMCTCEDILVVCDGSRSGLILQGKDGIVGSTLSVIDTAKQIQPFIRLIFQEGFNRFNSGMKGAAIPHLDTKVVLAEVIGLPPLEEQSRIVTRVEELMQLCDALEASGQLEAQQHAQLVGTLLATLTQSETPEALADNWQRIATHFDLLLDRPDAVDALEQTILQLAVRGLLVPQDPTDEPARVLLQKIRTEKDHLIAQGQIKRDKPLLPITDEEKPFDLPQGWEWVRFDELINPAKPIAYGVLVPGPDQADGVPFVRIADLSLTDPPVRPEKTIAPEVDAQFQRTRLEGGEILMGVVGSIGKLGVAPASWAGANIARAICRIVPVDEDLRSFVLFLLQTQFMQGSFAGDTRTLAQPTLNVGLIRNAFTPLPPRVEQSRIITRVNELRALCADLREKIKEQQSMASNLAEALIEGG